MIELHNGDCLDVIKEIPDNSIDCVVTDPPFGLEHDLTTDTSIEKVLEILDALKTKSNYRIIYAKYYETAKTRLISQKKLYLS